MDNRIFFSELLQDLPLWTAIFMSLYPTLQSKNIFFISLIIGIFASIYIWYLMKKGEYTLKIFLKNPSETFPFMIYSFTILIFLVILTYKGILYMPSVIWFYLLITSIVEFFFIRRDL